MAPTGKNSKAGFLAWRRRVQQSRIAAILSGRKSIDHRPGDQEIKDSEERYDAMIHEIPDKE